VPLDRFPKACSRSAWRRRRCFPTATHRPRTAVGSEEVVAEGRRHSAAKACAKARRVMMGVMLGSGQLSCWSSWWSAAHCSHVHCLNEVPRKIQQPIASPAKLRVQGHCGASAFILRLQAPVGVGVSKDKPGHDCAGVRPGPPVLIGFHKGPARSRGLPPWRPWQGPIDPATQAGSHLPG
jgi:hypothetical protein